MDGTEARKEPEYESKIVAAVDVGSNALRMSIAEVLPNGEFEILERLQRAVRLGQDSFRRGRLGGQSMRAAVGVLQDFRQVLRLYDVGQLRAVATSAVREASNADTFLDRVFMATAFQLEVIGTSEESQLTVSAVRRAMGDALDVNRGVSLIADVGGGSTLLTLLEDGDIVSSHGLRLGSIWLQEMLSTSEESPERSTELLRHHIWNALSTAQTSLPLDRVGAVVAVGGDARFAAREVGESTESADLMIVDQSDLDRLVRQCQGFTAEELSRKHGLSFAEAETINPALLVYQLLLKKTRAERLIISHVSMRDGLLLELARVATGQEDEGLLKSTIHSAASLAEKYCVDVEHSNAVAELTVQLFDLLRHDHGLGGRHRLLLRVAAMLHEVGAFINSRSLHKHSYYIISNSEMFGLNRNEADIVAHTARYHRGGGPKLTHVEYTALPREKRVVINKLASLLRLADALVRGHAGSARRLHFERDGDELIVHLPTASDLLLERRSISGRGDLFEDVYGMKVRLEEG